MTTGRRGIEALAALDPAFEKLLADTPEVESVSKITPTAGSVFVMTCAQNISAKEQANIEALWTRFFIIAGLPVPRLMILGAGMTIQQINDLDFPLPPFSEEAKTAISAIAVDAVKRTLQNGSGQLTEAISQAVYVGR